MPKHAMPDESHVERLTQVALSTGRAALEKFGPDSAVRAMQPWAERIERAQRKAVRRA